MWLLISSLFSCDMPWDFLLLTGGHNVCNDISITPVFAVDAKVRQEQTSLLTYELRKLKRSFSLVTRVEHTLLLLFRTQTFSIWRLHNIGITGTLLNVKIRYRHKTSHRPCSLFTSFIIFILGPFVHMLDFSSHFRESRVMDWWKSRKTDCSNPPPDLVLMKIQLWWSHVPLFLWCHRQACYYFQTKLKSQFSTKKKTYWQCIQTAEAPHSGWSTWPYIVQGQSALCFFLCKLSSIAEPNVN